MSEQPLKDLVREMREAAEDISKIVEELNSIPIFGANTEDPGRLVPSMIQDDWFERIRKAKKILLAENVLRVLDALALHDEKKDQFVRPDLLLAGNSTPKEIQKALDDSRYKTIVVEAGHLEGMRVPVGKSLTFRPLTEEGA